MFVHCVFYWLREDVPQPLRDEFRESLGRMTKLSMVQSGHSGTPAEVDRPIVDKTYSFALVNVFADRRGHDAFQVDEEHGRFRELCARTCARVVIYDFA